MNLLEDEKKEVSGFRKESDTIRSLAKFPDVLAAVLAGLSHDGIQCPSCSANIYLDPCDGDGDLFSACGTEGWVEKYCPECEICFEAKEEVIRKFYSRKKDECGKGQ